ncbi:MAG: ribosomal protein [Rickettsiaceae bacterium]|jgi:large subunit ribosomal protein L9|nr:ribosomal protein [Rickettsiaceae bacterium]
MKVILLGRVGRLGNVGDVVEVKDGYARNFLIPQGKVLRATNENKAYFESKRSDIEKDNAQKRTAAEKESTKIEGKFIVITRQAGDDGRLYGSVTSRDITEAAVADGLPIIRNQIALQNPIKAIGVYKQKIVLHAEVIANIFVNIARSAEEAAKAKEEFLNPKVKKEEDVAEAAPEAKSEEATEEAAE